MSPQRIVFPALEALYRELHVLFHKRPPGWHGWTPHDTFFNGVRRGCFALNTTFPMVIETVQVRNNLHPHEDQDRTNGKVQMACQLATKGIGLESVFINNGLD